VDQDEKVIFKATPGQGAGSRPMIRRGAQCAPGTRSYFSDGAWTSVRPGGAVFLPRGCLRTYRNDGDQASRHWVVGHPSP
jgi:hypothetical protein